MEFPDSQMYMVKEVYREMSRFTVDEVINYKSVGQGTICDTKCLYGSSVDRNFNKTPLACPFYCGIQHGNKVSDEYGNDFLFTDSRLSYRALRSFKI